jgi:hypothetical protein
MKSNMKFQEVLAAASQLSQEERLEVATRLLESLRPSYPVPLPKTAPAPDWKEGLHPLVRGLIGVVPSEDGDLDSLYVDYLEDKYR